MSEPVRDVLGIGNAIVDVIARVDDALLAKHGLSKGSMTLVDAERAERLGACLSPEEECSGGSAANTVAGLARVGGTAAYVGKVRDDRLGRVFQEDLRSVGVEYGTPAAGEGPPTGRCLVLVTPDAQRTMLTFLGASATLGPDDVDRASVEGAGITYLEGYLWDPASAKRAFLRAAALAHAAGRRVALSLSDPFCVARHRSEFREFLFRHVDILLANEAEIVSLFETSGLDEAIQELRGACEVAALTRGASGSVVVGGDVVVRVAAEPVASVVDTTGAGDLYASGFLYGLCRGRDLATCGRFGSLAAAEVIRHLGARPRGDLAGLFRGA
jgi:sugar/nucleoside kinase (ribokinase family)